MKNPFLMTNAELDQYFKNMVEKEVATQRAQGIPDEIIRIGLPGPIVGGKPHGTINKKT